MLGLLCAVALAQEPVRTAWIMAPQAANENLRRSLPEVHSVTVAGGVVDVRSAGFSLHFLGPFQKPLVSRLGGELLTRIPLRPAMEQGARRRTGPGAVGLFLNGVPLYNLSAEASYMGQNIWHFDTLAYNDDGSKFVRGWRRSPDAAHPSSLGVLEPMMADSSRHSPLLGFALDGFPIYGPWGVGGRRMRSGYRLRGIAERTKWRDGTMLTPGQYGPPVNDRFPLGTFIEDYEYKPGEGDLDESNGRFGVTPDYPAGTYAYFLTSDESNRLEFPYFIGGAYRGKPVTAIEPAWLDSKGRARLGVLKPEAGKPEAIRLKFPGARSLEIVHERPLHLMAVSNDLEVFAHIHPEWTIDGWYEVTHTFPRPGRYKLYAQFTLPGEAERVETFDVVVGGALVKSEPPASPPIEVKLDRPAEVRTGADLAFQVTVSGAPIEPYLGAWAHFVWIDRGMTQFIHAHPAESAGAPPDPDRPHIHGVSDIAAGPAPSTIRFETNFARAGEYKLWAQFQVGGNPVVMPFVVKVTGPDRVVSRTIEVPAGAIRVRVDASGFSPARIEAKTGKPLVLAIERAATPNCGSKIVFPGLGVTRDLPPGQTTVIELPGLTADLAFACGMGMYRGMIVAGR